MTLTDRARSRLSSEMADGMGEIEQWQYGTNKPQRQKRSFLDVSLRGFGDLQSEVCPLLHNFVEDSEVGDAGHVIHVGYEGVLSAPLLETFKEARVQKGLVEVAVSRRVPPARQNRVQSGPSGFYAGN